MADFSFKLAARSKHRRFSSGCCRKVLRVICVVLAIGSSTKWSWSDSGIESESENSPIQACKTINLMQLDREFLEPVPVYDQGATNTCYAHVLSQQLEYALRKQKKWTGADHISPYWIATAHKTEGSPLLKIRSSRLGFSSVHLALGNLRESKICKPSVLSAGISRTKGPIQLNDEDFFYLFEKFWPYAVPNIPREFSFVLDQLRADEGFMEWWKIRIVERRIVQEGSLVEVFERLKELRSEAPRIVEATRYMRDYVFGECQFENLLDYDIPFLSPMGRGMFYETNRSLRTQLEKILGGQRHTEQPAVVGYCNRIFDVEQESIPWFSFLLPRVLRATLFEGRCSPHYSLVVAQKPLPSDKTGCQYLIRNTRGNAVFSKQDECLCDLGDGTPRTCRYHELQDRGIVPQKVYGCWVRGSEFLPEIFDLAFLRF